MEDTSELMKYMNSFDLYLTIYLYFYKQNIKIKLNK